MSTRVPSAEARERIVAAAERLLRERPYRELDVGQVMAEAGLSRTIFYRHFDSLAAIVSALLDEIEADLFPVLETETMEEILRAAVTTFARHGRFLRAVQAAAFHDPTVEHAYRAMFDRFTATMTGQMREGMAAGRVAPGDAAELARAMNLFNNAYLLDTLGRDESFDQELALATLLAVWEPLTSHGSR